MDIADPATVELAEAAWLEAMDGPDPDALRRLMRPDCLVIHALVAHIHGIDDFVQYRARMGRITDSTTHNVSVRRFDGLAVVACLQDFHVAPEPDIPPFPIQAAVTRIWVSGDPGWLLGHMHLSRRHPPG